MLCSPAAAGSRWVNEEIAYFRRTHPARKVLALVVAGEPGADHAINPESACFPPNLLLRNVDDPAAGRLEPAAPDARKEADGREAAFLKLVAGLLGLPYDRLRQRELRRQQQRWAMVGLASIGLSTAFAVLAWQAMVARDAARAAQAQAEMEATTSRQTADFMVSLFQVSEPEQSRGNTITAREVLDRGVARIENVRIEKPLVKSRLLGMMGQVYVGLGIYPRAEELLLQSESLVDRAAATPEELTQRFDAQLELADLLYDMGEYAKAREVIARTSRPEEGRGNGARLGRLENLLGDLGWQDGDDNTAVAHYERALTALAGDDRDPVQRARALGGLGRIRLLGSNPSSSIPLLDDAYNELEGHFGRDHPDTLVALNLRANAAYRSGDSATAKRLWTEAVASGRKVYGERHPEVATFLSNLGLIELEAGHFAEAEQMFRTTMDIDRNVRGEGFDELSYTLNNLALARVGQGDLAEAESLFVEARDIASAHEPFMLGPILANLADLYCSTDRRVEGLRLAESSIEANRAEYGEEHWRSRQAELVATACGAPPSEAVQNGEALRAMLARWGENNLYVKRARELSRIIAAHRAA